jgi:hypothetical protein
MYSMQNFLASEAQTVAETKQQVPGVVGTYPRIIEMLLMLPQFMDRSRPDLDRAESTFYFYSHYMQAHATATCTYRCFEAGYYLEATILTRHLVEAFIQMRYLKNHLDLLEDHVIGKERVSFRKMFDAFSPGYYKDYYAQFLSEATHGVSYKMLMRTIGPVRQDGGTIVIGNHFDTGIATLIISGLTGVIAGYFNFLAKFLPRNTIASEPSVASHFDGLKRWLNGAITEFASSGTEPKDLYQHYLRLFADSPST